MTESTNFNPSFKKSFLAIWPICAGYIPLGLAMGVIGQKAGLSPIEVLCMSLMVFAGSGQFIAVSMIAAGASIPSIIITTFMINLRHLLMSSSLAVYFMGESRKKISVLSYTIVDETFAVNIDKLKKGNWSIDNSIVVNYMAFTAWAVSTYSGAYFGKYIPENSFGLDYALTAMFISLLVFQLKSSIFFITAGFSAIIAVITSIYLPGNSYIMIASVLAATFGIILKKKYQKND
ncbi:MAG: branched-chain amino acid ABC transporter permease [Deltaproteobacteria bacterium]|nr:MAG: branched-chain amino acid ABC transporter permease [Deltaproteobacteria bacterium]